MATECGQRWDEDQEFIEQRICFWMREIGRERQLSKADRDDLAQTFRLDLLQRLPGFDPAKASRRTFISLLIQHRARSLSEEHRAAKRGHQFPHDSLDESIDPEADTPMARHEMISEDDYLWATRGPVLSREASHDLEFDLQQVEKRLTALEVDLCQRLREMSITEAAAELGIPRTTLQDIVRRVGGKLAQAGLK